ncbi:uncharacterized protein LOC119585851 [Penaeus monodon]|uniref:uncharacterized protein LOC119585851 n=1 Tax=Penaeus monodon TaxID=6687 RepID=UPI0018A6E2EF|nr:uncharacterized protein LOC119585851 [Penaeus monodon]
MFPFMRRVSSRQGLASACRSVSESSADTCVRSRRNLLQEGSCWGQSLISHASKILLEILRQRLQYYLAPEIAEEQFGFTAGKGTTDAILAVRNIIQKVVNKQEEDQVWFLFIDYTKAFDSVFHDALWETLKDFGVPNHLTWLLKGLYDHAIGVVQVDNQHTEEFPFQKRGQGCLVSRLLFNAIGEKIMRKVHEKVGERPGKIIGGRAVWNIRYADDTTVIAKSRQECNEMGEALMDTSREVGLTINKKKTSAMKIHGDGEVELGEKIEHVKKVTFLGLYVTDDGYSGNDIKIRIGRAKSVTNKMVDVSKELGTKLKVRLAKALVALETSDKVKWTERKTNEWVREQVGVKEERDVLNNVNMRKIRKYGHWKRRGASLVLTTIEGETDSRGRVGRRRVEWMDNITAWGNGLQQTYKRSMVANMERVSEITLEYEVGIEESISKTSVTPRSARPAYGVRLQTPAFTLGELKLTQERDTTRMQMDGHGGLARPLDWDYPGITITDVTLEFRPSGACVNF